MKPNGHTREAQIVELLEVLVDATGRCADALEKLVLLQPQSDSRPSAWVENNSRGTTTGVKGYGDPTPVGVTDIVDRVAREAKRLQVMASGSLAGVMNERDD